MAKVVTGDAVILIRKASNKEDHKHNYRTYARACLLSFTTGNSRIITNSAILCVNFDSYPQYFLLVFLEFEY